MMKAQLNLGVLFFSTLASISLLSSCENLLGIRSQNELTNTVWQKEKVEILNGNQDLVRVIYPFSCESDELLKFAEKDQIIRQNKCSSNEIIFECGHWETSDDQLTILLGLEKVIPDLCNLSNHVEFVNYNSVDYQFSEEQLIIAEKGIDVFSNYLSTDTINKINSGELIARTYYQRSNSDIVIPDENDCCNQ